MPQFILPSWPLPFAFIFGNGPFIFQGKSDIMGREEEEGEGRVEEEGGR